MMLTFDMTCDYLSYLKNYINASYLLLICWDMFYHQRNFKYKLYFRIFTLFPNNTNGQTFFLKSMILSIIKWQRYD